MDYNRMIAQEMDETNQRYIQSHTQPTMLGGRRLREFVLPGMVNYAYPSSLAVSGDGENEYLGEESESDDEQPDFISMVGGRQNKVRKRGVAKAFRTYGRALKPAAKFVAPVADVARDVAISKLRGMGHGDLEGGNWFNDTLKTVGKVGTSVAKVAAPALTNAAAEALVTMALGGKVHKTGVAKALRTYGRALKPAAKFVAPVADVARDVAISKLQGMGRKGRKGGRVGASPSTYTPRTLTSYEPVIKGGARKLDRAAIVKAVMAKNGCGMIEASKFVKANRLY